MAAATPQTGEIRPDVCYPLRTFMQLAGLGRHAMRSARRKGLRVRRTANRAFVMGADWMEYLQRVDESAS